MVGQGLSAMTFSIIALYLYVAKTRDETVTEQEFHDLGNLTLAFVMLWAYMTFSQYLIIWSGNLPEEIHWYLHRIEGGWLAVVTVIALFHFAVPFVLLLMRTLKRNRQTLIWIATILFLMRYVEIAWLVQPTFRHEFFLHWLDGTTLLAVGGVWLFLFLRKFQTS